MNYAKKFKKTGNLAKDVRIELRSLIIKQTLTYSDRETVNQISENLFLKLFIGLKEFQEKAPFSASALVDFRKRFSAKFLAEINELIIANENKKDDENDTSNDSTATNSCTVIIDATFPPTDFAFPQDLSLLNQSRENL